MTVEARVKNPRTGRFDHYGLFENEEAAWQNIRARCQMPHLPDEVPASLVHLAASFQPRSEAEHELVSNKWCAHFEVGEPRRVHAICNGNLAETFDEIAEAETHADRHARSMRIVKAVRALGAHAIAAHRAELRAAWTIVDTGQDRPTVPAAT